MISDFLHVRAAVSEMSHIVRTCGTAVIQDMSHVATHDDIAHEDESMDLGRLSSFKTTATLERLRNRAYSPGQLKSLAEESPFKAGQITTAGIGLEVRLTKATANT